MAQSYKCGCNEQLGRIQFPNANSKIRIGLMSKTFHLLKPTQQIKPMILGFRPPVKSSHSMAHSFIELDKAMVHVIRLVSFFVIVVFILPAL